MNVMQARPSSVRLIFFVDVLMLISASCYREGKNKSTISFF